MDIRVKAVQEFKSVSFDVSAEASAERSVAEFKICKTFSDRHPEVLEQVQDKVFEVILGAMLAAEDQREGLTAVN